MASDDTDDKRDRSTILRRRMFFVGSALSVLGGCPPEQPNQPPDGSATPVASIPGTDAGALPAGTGSVSVLPEPSSVKIPPLAVPEGVNPTAKSHFERLVTVVPKIHIELDAADKSTRGLCDILDATCDGVWSAVAARLEKARNLQRRLRARCPGSSDDAKAFNKSYADHNKVIEERFTAIQKRIDAALKNDAQRKRWEEHKRNVAVPRPCLKFACDDW